MTKTKQTAQYKTGDNYHIMIGSCAFIECVNHPLMSDQPVRTSQVLTFDIDTGVFETKNTIYTPVK